MTDIGPHGFIKGLGAPGRNDLVGFEQIKHKNYVKVEESRVKQSESPQFISQGVDIGKGNLRTKGLRDRLLNNYQGTHQPDLSPMYRHSDSPNDQYQYDFQNAYN